MQRRIAVPHPSLRVGVAVLWLAITPLVSPPPAAADSIQFHGPFRGEVAYYSGSSGVYTNDAVNNWDVGASSLILAPLIAGEEELVARLSFGAKLVGNTLLFLAPASGQVRDVSGGATLYQPLDADPTGVISGLEVGYIDFLDFDPDPYAPSGTWSQVGQAYQLSIRQPNSRVCIWEQPCVSADATIEIRAAWAAHGGLIGEFSVDLETAGSIPPVLPPAPTLGFPDDGDTHYAKNATFDVRSPVRRSEIQTAKLEFTDLDNGAVYVVDASPTDPFWNEAFAYTWPIVPPGRYSWRARFTDTDGDVGPWSPSWTITLLPTPGDAEVATIKGQMDGLTDLENLPVSADCDSGTVTDAYAGDTYVKVGVADPEPGSNAVCVRIDGPELHEGIRITLPGTSGDVAPTIDDDAGACADPPLVSQGVGNPGHPSYTTVWADVAVNDPELWVCVNVDDQVVKRVVVPFGIGAGGTADVDRDPVGGAPSPLGDCTQSVVDLTFLLVVRIDRSAVPGEQAAICGGVNGRPVGASVSGLPL